jgi:putrescine transport system ATP-binding protein
VKITESNTVRQDLSGITWNDAVFFWWGDSAAVTLTT